MHHVSWWPGYAICWVNVVSSIGRVFRPLLRRRRKMAALPLPAAILDDLIPSFRFQEWGHPRWRPEAEGPPSCASASIGVEKRAPSLGWRHFRRRHHGSKMAAAEMTSGGRRDAREDVLQTSAPSMSPVEVWLYFLVRLKKKKKKSRCLPKSKVFLDISSSPSGTCPTTQHS